MTGCVYLPSSKTDQVAEAVAGKESFICIDTLNEDIGFNKMCSSFISDSILVARSFLNDSLLHGPDKTYYPNGNLRHMGNYYKGLKSGIFAYFDENEILQEAFDYVLVDYLEYENQHVYYVNNKIDTLKSSFILLKYSGNQISLNDSLKITIYQNHKFLKDSLYLHLGVFREDLSLVESDVLKFENNTSLNFYFKPSKKGVNYVEGYLSNSEDSVRLYFFEQFKAY